MNTSEFNTKLRQLADEVKAVLESFTTGTRRRSYSGKGTVRNLIQDPLLAVLAREFPKWTWSEEAYLDETQSVRDRADILATSAEYPDTVIIVEIDTLRSDQVAKKFVSRMALAADKNVIYATVCYPNTNAQSKPGKKETNKYSNYINKLMPLLNAGDNPSKHYIFVPIR